MESNTGPPRYEDVIHVTREKAQLPELQPMPPVAPSVLPAAVLPQTVEQPEVQTVRGPTLPTPRILNVVNNLTHFSLGAVVFCAFIIGNAPWRTPHVFLCVIGYMVLLTQSVIAFSAQGWARGLGLPQKQLIHGTLHILGSSLALAGCLSRVLDPMSFFYYPGHVVTGGIVMLLTIASLVGGILNYKYYEKIKQTKYKNHNAYLFNGTIFMAFLCLCFAFGESDYFVNGFSTAMAIIYTLCAMFGVLFLAHLRLKKS